LIAVDTNILVYAHREDSEWHRNAYACVQQLAQEKGAWAIPWPCLHEFVSIVTHPRVYAPPTPLSAALKQIDAWIEAPSLVLLSESDGYWPGLKRALESGQVTGGRVHDAHVIALCRLHGVRELWTADRDFSRFPGLALRNPLVKRA
jgi:toxin-antitoxin system PIN domain toxin